MKNGAGHIAPSLSCIDILVVLYYNILNINKDPLWDKRDRLVFSKAHGGYGLYAILADLGFIKKPDWLNFYKHIRLSGCIERNLEYGLEVSCGSLGHGLPQAVGIAYSAKLQNQHYKVYCIVGDGEMQEGSNWEAIQFAVKYNLNNLIVIVDHNRLQAMDTIENILTVKGRKLDLEKKFCAFGFKPFTCNGNNINSLFLHFKKIIRYSQKNNQPQVLVANTTKGYGLVCMENVPKFHFRIPTNEELKMGCRYE